jgi:hypothetical protein
MLKLVRILVPVGALLAASQAHAHIETVGDLMSRGGDQKSTPCDGARGAGEVYTFQPGVTIKLQISETIPHPGYFRIAFDQDGQDDFVTPAGTSGENGSCGGDPKCGPGKEDYCNNASVLYDNLDPHASGGGSILMPKMYTWNVTLPNVECENCTLQIIQMMNDLDIHSRPYPADDIYHRCIDITLKKDATNSPGVTTEPATTTGMKCAADGGGAAGAGGTGAAGTGAAGAGGAPAGAAGAAAGSGAAGSGAAAAGTGAAGTGAAGTGAAGAGAGTAGRAAGGAAGTPPSSGAAGRASGTAGIGMDSNPLGQAGAAGSVPPATDPAPAADEGGCSVGLVGSNTGANASGWLLLIAAAFAVTNRRRPSRRA